MAKVQSKAESAATSAVPIPRSIQLIMVAAVIAAILLVRPYFGTILFSGLVAYLFNPVYKFVLRKTKRVGVSITATLITAVLAVLIPLGFIIMLTVSQVDSIINDIQSNTSLITSESVQHITENSVNRVNKVIIALPGGESLEVNKDQVQSGIKQLAVEFLNLVVNFIKSFGSAFFGLISTSILSLFLIVALLRYQDELVKIVHKVSPYDERLNNLYMHRAGTMTKAMVGGQFVIALCQGMASAASLWIAGLNYIGFFAVFLTFMSFIPLGAGIITIPIGIILILTGNVWQGIFVILFHVIVVSSIDNFLRPALVPKDASLNTALMLLAVFSGMALFGPSGIIFGPVLMILILTTFRLYGEYNKTVRRATLPTHGADGV